MANLLGNMLTLQTSYLIPMQMDISTKDQIAYYKHFVDTINSTEGGRLLDLVINDLEKKSSTNH